MSGHLHYTPHNAEAKQTPKVGVVEMQIAGTPNAKPEVGGCNDGGLPTCPLMAPDVGRGQSATPKKKPDCEINIHTLTPMNKDANTHATSTLPTFPSKTHSIHQVGQTCKNQINMHLSRFRRAVAHG